MNDRYYLLQELSWRKSYATYCLSSQPKARRRLTRHHTQQQHHDGVGVAHSYSFREGINILANVSQTTNCPPLNLAKGDTIGSCGRFLLGEASSH